MSKAPVPLEDRFWPKVDKMGAIPVHRPELGHCWVFMGAKNAKGQVYIWRQPGDKRAHQATRVSWEMHYGPITGGLYVLHKCDNPSCVRPEHLFLGTQRQNLQDAAQKRRMHGAYPNRPEPAWWEEARALREQGLTQKAIADLLGKNRTHVLEILHR